MSTFEVETHLYAYGLACYAAKLGGLADVATGVAGQDVANTPEVAPAQPTALQFVGQEGCHLTHCPGVGRCLRVPQIGGSLHHNHIHVSLENGETLFR